MEKIRYTQRICIDKEKIDRLLLKTSTGTLGLCGEEYPYVVPIHYIWYDGMVYFHGMGSGKKIDILQRTPKVCFSVYEEYGTVKDPIPCHADTTYLSVMIFGQAEKVTNYTEAAEALQILVEKYLPNTYKSTLSPRYVEKYTSGIDKMNVSVFRIKPIEITAKENAAGDS